MDPQGRLVQLTWLDGLAYVRDPDTLEVGRASTPTTGEGWGLTTLGDGTLVMTDGSDVLTLRDPEDFTELEARVVQRVGGDADRLNELDWDGEWLWANRYQTDELLRIDPECATVTGVADLAPLREAAAAEAASNGTPIDVTNGIAHLPGTDRYLRHRQVVADHVRGADLLSRRDRRATVSEDLRGEQLMQRPASGAMHDRHTLSWQLNSRWFVLIGGARAAIMQVADPKVAAGVAQYSAYRTDPLGRLERTMDAMLTIGFGTPERREQVLDRAA